jgi:uncharacterized membrane protein YccF (DUF307 family)
MGVVRVVGNVLWFLLAGLWLALGYAVAALVICITIIRIPFGVQAFNVSVLALWPFGRAIVDAGSASTASVVYAVPADPTHR